MSFLDTAYNRWLVCMWCVLVDGTVVAVEQENIAHDEVCVEEDHDQEPEVHVPQPILYIHPKAEMTSYSEEQTEANWCDDNHVVNFVTCR